MNLLKKKVAFISGGTGGIGQAIAKRLAKDGFNLIINHKNSKTKKEAILLARKITKLGSTAFIIEADISKEDEVKRIAATIKKRFGSLNLLIHNAGVNKNHTLKTLNAWDFDAIMNTNLKGGVMLAHHLLPLIAKKNSGIIFISSMNAFTGSPGRTAYVTSKSALIGLTRALALELAPSIRVNTIVPGYVNTAMFKRFSSKTPTEKIKNIPLKRLGTPDDVAGITSFLASKDSSYVTGQCMHVNGGAFFA